MTMYSYKWLWLTVVELSIAKQMIPTYINPSPLLIPRGIHLIFKRKLRRERSQTYSNMLSAKQGSIWYHFYNAYGITWSGIKPMTSRLQGKHSTTQPLLHYKCYRVSSNLPFKLPTNTCFSYTCSLKSQQDKYQSWKYPDLLRHSCQWSGDGIQSEYVWCLHWSRKAGAYQLFEDEICSSVLWTTYQDPASGLAVVHLTVNLHVISSVTSYTCISIYFFLFDHSVSKYLHKHRNVELKYLWLSHLYTHNITVNNIE